MPFILLRLLLVSCKNSDYRKKIVDSWFSYLQNQICQEFENIEGNNKKFLKNISENHRFLKTFRESGTISGGLRLVERCPGSIENFSEI